MSMPPVDDYVSYLNFVWGILSIACQLVAIPITLRFLLLISYFKPQRLKVQKLSASLSFYLVTHLVFSSLALPYNIYVTAGWKPGPYPGYNLYLLYWLGIHTVDYYCISSMPVLFLTIDRILVIKMALRNSDCQKDPLLPESRAVDRRSDR